LAIDDQAFRACGISFGNGCGRRISHTDTKSRNAGRVFQHPVKGWAAVHEHVAEEITLLCDSHHRERTNGLLPIEAVREANSAPFNLRVGSSKPYDLHFDGDECSIAIGGNHFTTKYQGYGTQCVPLVVDDIPLIGFVMGDGHLLLNLNVFDESNRQVLWIRNNQLVYSMNPWDIQWVGRNLIIRESSRKILLDMTFETPGGVNINRGRLLCNGVEIIVANEFVLVTNNKMLFEKNSVENVMCGIALGPVNRYLPTAVAITDIPRYLGDRSDALRWAQENMDSSV
ncbi:MAG: hypothetical protein ACYDCC_15235, partial [Actinomycetota bacterium]